MAQGVVIPVHLAVHILGLTVSLGLAVFALARRRDAGTVWPGLVVGGILLALSHVAEGALLVGEVAWPVYVRAAGYAALAVGAAGRVTALPVVVGIAPPAAHLAAGIAGLMAALATARGALGRGRVVGPLALGLGLWAAADVVTRASVPVAAGLSVAGSVAAGWWLIRRARRSLLTRLLTLSVALLLLVVLGLASVSGLVFSLDLERDQLVGLDELADARATQFTDDWPRELRRVAAPLAGATLTGELNASRQGQPGELDGRARAIASLPGVDLAVLIDAEGRVAGSWDSRLDRDGPLDLPDARALAEDPLMERAAGGTEAAGTAALGGRELMAIGAVPVVPRAEDGAPLFDRLAGVLAVGRVITDERTVAEIAARSGVDATLVAAGEPVVSSLQPSVADSVARAAEDSRESRLVDLGDVRRYLATAVLTDERGDELGMVVLTEDATAVADVERNVTRSLFLAAVVGMLLAAALAWSVSRRTTEPIRDLTAAAEKIAGGDLSVRVGRGGTDEVGRLAAAFDHMTDEVADRETALRSAVSSEAELRRRLEVITTSIGEGLVATDRAGRIQTVNPAAAALLGGDADELVGAEFADVLEGTDETGRRLADVLGSPDSGDMASVRGRVPRGNRAVDVAATAAPLRDEEGTPLGRVYVLRDISGQAEVERMKSEFLANISHELRTPLTPIKGYAEVLKAKDVDRERTHEFASNIAASAQRLERIIGMLVDFASLESGRMRVELRPTTLGEVVDEVLDEWRASCPDRTFTRRLETDLPEVNVDPHLLHRVLEELVDNAVKFSSEPVSLLGAHDRNGYVRLTVRDRGQGIDPEELASIRGDFSQADGSATRRYGGLGLGLAIVERILDRFDGDLELTSDLEHGTDVHVLLPVVEG